MELPCTGDQIENASELLRLFEQRWPFPKVVCRGEAKRFPTSLVPKLFRLAPAVAEFAHYRQSHAAYQSSDSRDFMFDRLHDNVGPLSLPYLALAQHRGVPTRLLDVTLSPLVALFFACNSEDAADGFVYFFHNSYLDISLFPEISELDTLLSSDRIRDYRPREDTVLFYRPRWPNSRLAAQVGAFLLSRGDNQQLWTSGGVARIPAERKAPVLQQLGRIGIDATTLFPSADGAQPFVPPGVRQPASPSVARR